MFGRPGDSGMGISVADVEKPQAANACLCFDDCYQFAHAAAAILHHSPATGRIAPAPADLRREHRTWPSYWSRDSSSSDCIPALFVVVVVAGCSRSEPTSLRDWWALNTLHAGTKRPRLPLPSFAIRPAPRSDVCQTSPHPGDGESALLSGTSPQDATRLAQPGSAASVARCASPHPLHTWRFFRRRHPFCRFQLHPRRARIVIVALAEPLTRYPRTLLE